METLSDKIISHKLLKFAKYSNMNSKLKVCRKMVHLLYQSKEVSIILQATIFKKLLDLLFLCVCVCVCVCVFLFTVKTSPK